MAGKKKELSSEKAAAEISDMLMNGEASSAEDAVKQREELKPGLKHFEADSQPVSRGSGPMATRIGW